MSKVVLELSTSLDGFIAGPNDEIEPLHAWLPAEDSPSHHDRAVRPGPEVLDEATGTPGAIVSGRAERLDLELTRVLDSPGVTHPRYRFA